MITIADRLEPEFEAILDMLIEGDSYNTISKKYNISKASLVHFFSDPNRSACVRHALELSAQSFEEKGEQALLAAPSTLTEITRARELAQHYRWQAKCRNPKKYSDKIDITAEVKTEGNLIITGTKFAEIIEEKKPPIYLEGAEDAEHTD